MSDLGFGLLDQGQGSSRSKKPKKIVLSATAVPENALVGSAIAMISADGTAPVSFAITADPDGKFALRGNWLLLAAPLDHGIATAHRVEITATNSAGWVSETFTLAVTDIAAPTDIAISATAVPEDAAIGSTIAMISADGSTPVGFSITADPDGQFAISGDRLLLAEPLDYEMATAHQVKITASNGAGSVSEVFTIAVAVADVVEAVAPSDIALSAVSVAENAPVGATVATVSADGTAPVTFSKVSDPDGKFTVSGNQLQIAAPLNYETATSHSVTVRATNSAGSFDETFTITVTDVVEAPSGEFASYSYATYGGLGGPGSNDTHTVHTVAIPAGARPGMVLTMEVAPAGRYSLRAAGCTQLEAPGNEMYLFRKTIVGDEGDSITVSVFADGTSTPASRRIAAVTRLWPAGVQISTAGNFLADPKAVTASWGSAKNVFVTAHAKTRTSDWEVTGPPANYGNLVVLESLDANNSTEHVGLVAATRQLEAASDDPGPFVSTGDMGFVRSVTYVVSPPSGGGTQQPDPDPDAELVTSVTIPAGNYVNENIVFSWNEPAVAGLDASGTKAYVVGPVTGVTVTPAAEVGATGAVAGGAFKNPTRSVDEDIAEHAVDGRMDRYNSSLNLSGAPTSLVAGDVFVKVVGRPEAVTNASVRDGMAKQYAPLHCVSAAPPSADALLRPVVGWPGRNDADWYEPDIEGLLDLLPNYDHTIDGGPAFSNTSYGKAWPTITELRKRAMRLNISPALSTSDVDYGSYESFMPLKWARIGTNYGQYCAGAVGALMLCLCVSKYTRAEKKEILTSLIQFGIETHFPLLTTVNDDGKLSRGGHRQFEFGPQILALHALGMDTTAIDPHGGNVHSCFKVTQDMIDNVFVPHDDPLLPPMYRKRTLGDQSAAGANQVIVPSGAAGVPTLDRAGTLPSGSIVRNLAGTKTAVLASTHWISATALNLTGPSPFSAGDTIYCTPENPAVVALGAYDWMERSPAITPSQWWRWSPTTSIAYRNTQGFGGILMALHAMGLYTPAASVLEAAMGYLKMSETANYPTAEHNYQSIKGSFNFDSGKTLFMQGWFFDNVWAPNNLSPV